MVQPDNVVINLWTVLPWKPAEFGRRPAHQGQVLRAIQGQGFVDNASRIHVSPLRPLARHREDVLLLGHHLAAVPAAQNLRLKKQKKSNSIFTFTSDRFAYKSR